MTLINPVRKTPETLDPSSQRWLDLVALAVAESKEPVWSDAIDVREHRPPESPLLHGAIVHVNAGSISELVMRFAAVLGIVTMKRVEPLSLILLGVERDSETLDALASRLEVPADTVAVLAQLSSLPLLLNAAKTLDADASRTWHRGYCPVCGAWPSMAEMRGIQRERRMRCGCCGSDWLLPILRCAFCDETDHQKLGFLLNEDGGQHFRVETCSTCRGYLKTLTTLGILPFTTLALKDASTIAYDLAAQDRGYSRPSRPGFQVHVEIVQ